MAIAAILALTCTIHCAAQQEKGFWRAASNTAAKITGDVTIADSKFTVNFMTYPLASIRSLQPAEVSSVFDADVNTAGQGTLYRLHVPSSTHMLHHNTLCGTDDTQWMAAYLSSPRTLELAFFSGDDAPVFTMDAISNSSRLCGTFSFAR
jgi:hypothetical protein